MKIKQNPMQITLKGPPACGKSSLARVIRAIEEARDKKVFVIDPFTGWTPALRAEAKHYQVLILIDS